MFEQGQTAVSVEAEMQLIVDRIREALPAENGWTQIEQGGFVATCNNEVPSETRATSAWKSAGSVDSARIGDILDEVLSGTGLQWSLSGQPDDGLYLAGEAYGLSVQLQVNAGAAVVRGYTGCQPKESHT